MNRSFYFIHFKYCLKKNRSRFTRTPYISKVRKDYFTVDFVGCNGLVYLLVDRYSEFSIWSRFNTNIEIIDNIKGEDMKSLKKYIREIRNRFDWVFDCDTLVSRNNRGFYCAISDDNKYFKIREELIIQYAYDPFLKWVNKVLLTGNIIFHSTNCTKIVEPDSFNIVYKKWDIIYKYTLR